MRRASTAIAVLALFSFANASAQPSTSLAMGSSMVHGGGMTNASRSYLKRTVTQPQSPPTDLHAVLERAVLETRVPDAMDDGATLARMSISGDQLVLTAQIKDGTGKVSMFDRSRGENALCNYPGFLALLHYGATIRSVYVDQRGHEVGAAIVTRQECDF